MKYKAARSRETLGARMYGRQGVELRVDGCQFESPEVIEGLLIRVCPNLWFCRVREPTVEATQAVANRPVTEALG